MKMKKNKLQKLFKIGFNASIHCANIVKVIQMTKNVFLDSFTSSFKCHNYASYNL